MDQWIVGVLDYWEPNIQQSINPILHIDPDPSGSIQAL
jgi:hypothetical protein